MTTIINREVDSFLKNQLEKALLRDTAGYLIECPQCHNIMDWRRTVHAELNRIVDDGKPEHVQSYAMCGGCWDKVLPVIQTGIAKAQSRVPGRLRAELDIVDGRDHRFDDMD